MYSCIHSFLHVHVHTRFFYRFVLLQYSCVPLVGYNRLRGNTADVAPQGQKALTPETTQCWELIDTEEEWGEGEVRGDDGAEAIQISLHLFYYPVHSCIILLYKLVVILNVRRGALWVV